MAKTTILAVGGKLVRRLWKDDGGALLATEWVVVATILILGIIPALVAVRQGVLSELTEFANATMSLDQSYCFSGQVLTCAAADATVTGQDNTNGNTNGNANNGTTGNNGLHGLNNSSGNQTGTQANGQTGTGSWTQSGTWVSGQAATAGSCFQDKCNAIQTQATKPACVGSGQNPCD